MKIRLGSEPFWKRTPSKLRIGLPSNSTLTLGYMYTLCFPTKPPLLRSLRSRAPARKEPMYSAEFIILLRAETWKVDDGSQPVAWREMHRKRPLSILKLFVHKQTKQTQSMDKTLAMDIGLCIVSSSKACKVTMVQSQKLPAHQFSRKWDLEQNATCLYIIELIMTIYSYFYIWGYNR